MSNISQARVKIIAHKVKIGEISIEEVSPVYKTAVRLYLNEGEK